MAVSVLDMSVSVDGFIVDPDDYLGGDEGERLHHWAASPDPDRPVQEVEDEWPGAGAVPAGRRTAELMDHWGGSHAGLPIFVPSHRRPPPAVRWGYPLVTYVSDGIENAMAQARRAAGDRDVQAPTSHATRSQPVCSTRSSCTRSRSCWARGVASSTSFPGSWSSRSSG